MTADVAEPIPTTPAELSRWIVSRKGPKNRLDPHKPYAFLRETEPDGQGGEPSIATIFLTNRECPWRCLYCDLWQNTLDETAPPGAIAAQIRYALEQLDTSDWIKLYNAGSFFDPRAISPNEYDEIAELLQPFKRVIVECHPSLVGHRADRFQELVRGQLEVAMGLETVHPDVLPRLNKGMTLQDFSRSAERLRGNGIDLRTFILVRPPFMTEEEGVEWACRSLEFAWACGARVSTLIPTRAGNGAMDELARRGLFEPPCITSLEHILEFGISHGRSLVFADTWDLEKFADCGVCFAARNARLEELNRTQTILPAVVCRACGGAADA